VKIQKNTKYSSSFELLVQSLITGGRLKLLYADYQEFGDQHWLLDKKSKNIFVRSIKFINCCCISAH
jgi:hypothetical protein